MSKSTVGTKICEIAFFFFSFIHDKSKGIFKGLEYAHCDKDIMNKHKDISISDGKYLRCVSCIHSNRHRKQMI